MLTHFNFPKYSTLLATLIQENLQNDEKPIVIGIHGEWGSGKTTLLQEIQEKIENLNEKHKDLIVPVFFNAWRFEKEEHLIIPLLKTLYYELEKRETLNNNEIYNALKYVKDGLFSIIAGLEFEIGNATVGKVKYSPKNSLEYNEKKYLQRKEEQKSKKFSKCYESTYFDIINKIEALSKSHNENDVNVKFLFLIDDLDRCLPENTVKMLESIKLFLDIPNCAFVLAVDKEVVELGVEHHYRAYKDMKEQLPITGSEYLEKMITLPFALPSIQKEKIKEFITQHQKYKTLFTEDKEDELLNLFCNTVPAIPRKIIRSLDLYSSTLEKPINHNFYL
jgi:predicted KAP-like P-loop ATPase